MRFLDPRDASTLLSKLMNCLYLLAAIVLGVLAYLRGEPLPLLPEVPAVEAPAPPPAAPVALEAKPAVELDATPSTPPDGTSDGEAFGAPDEE